MLHKHKLYLHANESEFPSSLQEMLQQIEMQTFNYTNNINPLIITTCSHQFSEMQFIGVS